MNTLPKILSRVHKYTSVFRPLKARLKVVKNKFTPQMASRGLKTRTFINTVIATFGRVLAGVGTLVSRLKNVHRATIRKVFPFALGALVIMIPVVYLVLNNPHEVKAVSWSPSHGSYIQRKQLTLVNNSGATLHASATYKVTLDTSALYTSGNLLATCDDLRVVYQPSDTTAVELKRNLEYASGTTCSTSSATQVVFPLQADLSNAATSSYYYIYYDNPDATAYSSSDALDAYNVGAKEATFVAPFNGTTTALAAGSGTPTTESGAIRYSGSKSALSFDGMNDVINAGTEGGVADMITVESWVYLSRLDNPAFYTIIAKDGTWSGTGTNYQVDIRQGGKIEFAYRGSDSSANEYRTTGTPITANSWYHIAVTYDRINNPTIYVNGASQAATYATGGNKALVSNSNSVCVGALTCNSNYFAGLLDEVRVSNTVRYTANFTPQTSPFVRDEYTKLLLHFDENGDDPRNTGKAIDDSGNSNHGTITGAKYVSGLVGVDNSSTTTGYEANQSYASHQGVFIEEGTTNKITNPSFENSTSYATNWSSPAVFDYDSSADIFTAGAAKRNSAGPFASGVISQGKADSTGTGDAITIDRGTQINGNFYSNTDVYQGSMVFWITPEWNGNDGLRHDILRWSGSGAIYKHANGYLYAMFAGGSTHILYNVSSWTAGTTYNVVVRWDSRNKLDATNYMSTSVNDSNTFGYPTGTFIPQIDYSTLYVGGDSTSAYPSNALIEGLTIYRRPLWDGTYGIDVGNGDEINQIYNSGIGKDPTLVTGSWDVVFALPTNATTGALATGTGNAWSHPHASNLLYTSTTNTGGFMMNGTPATDGFSTVNPTQTLTLQPGASDGIDTNLMPSSPNTNYGTNTEWYIYTDGNEPSYISLGLAKFDLSTLTGTTISSATLTLYQSRGDYTAPIKMSRILAANSGWTESGATWNTINGSTAWAGSAGARTLGTDYSSTLLYNGTVDTVLGEKSFSLNTDEFTSMVANNNGFVVWGGNLFYNHQFSSSDNATAVQRPKLTVNYTSAAPTISALTTSEKIFSGGYKFTSTGANQGISRSFTATSGGGLCFKGYGA